LPTISIGIAGGEVLDQVDVAGLAHPVEQPIHQRLEAGLHLGDRLRRQRTDDQAADPGVQRRVVEHQARRVVLVEQRVAVLRLVFGLLVGAEQRRVLVDVLAVGIPRQQDAAVRHAPDRLALPQRA
jgi:hypothetical protein